MADIVLTGLATNDPVPGEYVEVAFSQGPASLATSVDKVIFIGNMLATGAGAAATIYGPDTAIPMTGEDDAVLLFGAGSELHRQIRRFMKRNTTTPVYAIAVAEGGSATASTGTITIATTATGAGTLRIFVDDEFVDVGFVTGDTPTVIAAAAVAQINSKTHWAFTAANVAGVITITSKQKGLRANLHRYFARIIPFTGVGTTVSPTVSTLTSGGTVSDDLTAALAVIAPQRFYYNVPAAVDSTQLVKVITQINTQALPINGNRQRMIWGSVDSLANTIAIVDAINAARSEVAWQPDGDIPPSELAAVLAAAYTLYEAPSVPRLNFNFYGQADGEPWGVKAPKSGTVPSRSQVYAALNAGVSPIAVQGPNAYLVKRVTNRYKSGAVLDYRIRDPHKVLVCDRYADSLISKAALQMRGKEIGDDPKKNEPTPGPRVVTPRVVKAMIDGVTDVYSGNDLLQNASVIKSQTLVLRDSGNRTRMGAKVPLQPIDILDQLAFRVDQVA
jgi:phage tail sheath gpL-like